MRPAKSKVALQAAAVVRARSKKGTVPRWHALVPAELEAGAAGAWGAEIKRHAGRGSPVILDLRT